MYPKAVEIAERLFSARLRRLESHGITVKRGSKEWKALRKQYVPPYKTTHFIIKYRKLAPEEPSRTVPAHLGKDCYSHIHPDDSQARTISVREAARLQSFPDAFEFRGSMNARFTQIGNAVPPLMAFAIASHLYKLLGRAARVTARRRLRAPRRFADRASGRKRLSKSA
jgi:DNA (cytosine-5)-methyltransferase 1